MRPWTLLWTDTRTFETAICSCDGSKGYELHKTLASACAEANRMNLLANKNRWTSRYTAVVLPDNIPPGYDVFAGPR